MKLLENINLVQFFLYEAKDVETGLNTAFLGPNGTGKSALLDAIQVVMLAADGNKTHFNASSEGKHNSRTLRDYCLGSYIPGGSTYARTSANTYVGLVFRDSETGIPFTAGVSIRAYLDEPKAEVNGYFILPGVALTAKQYLQIEGTRETVMPWRAFQHMAADLCRLESTSPVFSLQNPSDFLRRLLIGHLAGPGDKPNPQSLRAAFSRSLKLNERIVNLDATLRQHLIEPMPTGVKQFRARLDDVRDLRDLIARLRVRIDRATEVADKYATVKRERTSEANLMVLKHTYATERLGVTVDAGEAEVEKLDEQLATAAIEVSRAEANMSLATKARDRAIANLHSDPGYQEQAGRAESLKQLSETLQEKQKQLESDLRLIMAALSSVSELPGMDAHRQQLESAASHAHSLEQMRRAAEIPPAVAIQAAAQLMGQAYGIMRREAAQAESEEAQAKAKLRDARLAQERAGKGLSSLHESTTRLMGVLSDAGINAVPVCDLVRVSDASWQPAIEGWLGRHAEALLVQENQELDAIRVYRSKAGSHIYGAKLALPSRVREWLAKGDGQYAAQLIQGQNLNAVRYLQGELGRTALAETDDQLRTGVKAISKEGMASSGGGIERRRLPGTSELRLGRTDSGATRQRAEQELQSAIIQFESTSETAQKFLSGLQKLAPFSDPEALQADIEGQFIAVTQTASAVADFQAAQERTLTDSLDALNLQKKQADDDAVKAHALELHWTSESIRLAEKKLNLNGQIIALKARLEIELVQERKSRLDPLYSASEVERHRTRLDDKHEEQWDNKLLHLDSSIQRSRATASTSDREAWNLFANFISDYNLKNNDVQNQDWLRAYEFILAERKRIQDFELVEQEHRAEEAYTAAVKVFRSDVAQSLLTGFDQIEEQITGLTAVLKSAPPFTNDERYEFRYKVVDEHRNLHDFLRRVRTHGVDDDLFGGPGEIPEEFRLLVEGDSSVLLEESSPLNDHRRFFSYDVEIFQSNGSVGMLSNRFGSASGGEHRTPVYLIFGAALAAAYGRSKGSNGGGGIMLLDEAFEKMDPQNIRAAVQFLNSLGLQLIMAGPESDQGKLSSFLSIYYDMARFGTRNIQMKKNAVLNRAQELLQSDNYLLNPDILTQEMARLAEEQSNVG